MNKRMYLFDCQLKIRFEIPEKEYVALGRAKDNDIVLPIEKANHSQIIHVSRNHCKFHRYDLGERVADDLNATERLKDSYLGVIVDAESRNKTYVNEREIPKGIEFPLKKGDTLIFGDYKLEVGIEHLTEPLTTGSRTVPLEKPANK